MNNEEQTTHVIDLFRICALSSQKRERPSRRREHFSNRWSSHGKNSHWPLAGMHYRHMADVYAWLCDLLPLELLTYWLLGLTYWTLRCLANA